MKIASRHLLPLEIFMAAMLLSWGLSGWIGRGLLARTLEASGQNAEWGLVLCGIGAAQLVLCTWEWARGRQWDDRRLYLSVTARYWLALLSMVVWIYVVYMMATLKGMELVFSIALQTPLGVIFSAWVFVENRKVGCVLDPKVPTLRLQRQILAERERALRPH